MRLAFLFLISLLPLSLLSQMDFQSYGLNPDVRIRWKEKDGKCLVRICPTNSAAWSELVDNGTTIRIYAQGNTNVPIFSQNLKPLSKNEFIANAQDEIEIELAKLIHPNKDSLKQEFADFILETNEEINELRYLFSSFTTNSNFRFAKMAGLGFEFEISSRKFRLDLNTLDTESADYSIDIDLDNTEIPTAPELEYLELDRRIDFVWQTTMAKPHFYGYELESSEDGETFYNVESSFGVENIDTLNDIAEFQIMSAVDSLESNDIPKFYRLNCYDYFGEKKATSKVVRAMGSRQIEIGPYFTKTQPTDSNHVVLQWEVLSDFADLVDSFIIYHSDSLENTFKILGTQKADIRQAIYPMYYESNHYLLVTMPKRGRPVHSYPAFCLSYDTLAPHKPINLVGVIDTSGVVELNWSKNKDWDLFGYELFRTNFSSTEFFKLSDYPILDTFFIDTINLSLSVDSIYYQLRALDKRNIASNFSDTLKLKRPDVIPPVEANIHSYDSTRDSIVLHWQNSPSEDVLSHTLFRKIWKNENSWTEIKSFAVDSDPSTFVDYDVRLDELYAYTIIANDDDGLSSPPCEPVLISLRDNGLREEISLFTGTYQKDRNSILLNWEYERSDVFAWWIYKSPTSKPISLFKKLDALDLELEDTAINKNKTYQYYIKAVFEDGTTSPFSSLLLVETSDDQTK